MPHWTYEHVDLGEPPLPDGSAIRRPVVLVVPGRRSSTLIAVVDSGSPMSVADASLFPSLGVDLNHDQPLYSVPLTLGGGSGQIPVYFVELLLKPPASVNAEPIPWRLQIGARANWRLPFAILFGQRGWFDEFRTTIDRQSTTIEV